MKVQLPADLYEKLIRFLIRCSDPEAMDIYNQLSWQAEQIHPSQDRDRN